MQTLAAAVRRRSCLSVPGDDARKQAKAAASAADEVVLDLEDAVTPQDKDQARTLVAETLATWAGPPVAVRVNPPRSRWCHRDVEMCVAAGGVLSSIVVPKVDGPGDLAFIDRLLDGLEADVGRSATVGVQALIESAPGLQHVGAIAATTPRLQALILGYADLAAALGRRDGPWDYARDAVLVAARAAGVQAIDGPHLGVADGDVLRGAVRHARQLGFDGKWVIHPGQLDTVNAGFTPTAEEIDMAGRVLAAFAAAAGNGHGAVTVDGRMVDEAVALAARRVLAQAPAPRPPSGSSPVTPRRSRAVPGWASPSRR